MTASDDKLSKFWKMNCLVIFLFGFTRMPGKYLTYLGMCGFPDFSELLSNSALLDCLILSSSFLSLRAACVTFSAQKWKAESVKRCHKKWLRFLEDQNVASS
ncbi:hypothetical protein WUBG_14927 [Wuchereria bancrofti]|uniref:Uncharacterized protein n=1 Tax=Wuchereria bancrofti TaxID=6293 RepID=J9DWL4_WUCBA|nr:hypothetical protein WUBG_14927 [Wuchereria bancrofti]